MNEFRFDHDERLAYAETPPSSWYTDASTLALEKERVFSRTWQLVGRAEQVAEPGSYFTTTIGDEPVLVVRGNDGELRALSNVCRHRAGPVAAGEGRRKAFQCGYHGWTYTLDGCLIGAPEFDRVECFEKREVALPRFRASTWHGLVFVTLDPNAAPLEETFDGLHERLGGRDFGGYRFAARKEWVVECNWKVYVDNYLEGYHIPIVHPSLNKALDYGRYHTETRGHYSIQHAPIRQSAASSLGASEGASEEAHYGWVFPNLMINAYPDNYSTNLILPLGPERTMTVFEWFFEEPERPETREAVRRTVEFSDEVQREDIGICETVQRGLRSSTYTSGRYSVKRENGVHHFHGLLARYFADERARTAAG